LRRIGLTCKRNVALRHSSNEVEIFSIGSVTATAQENYARRTQFTLKLLF
jgi:hypothetical protein